jgi:hypothetical protein
MIEEIVIKYISEKLQISVYAEEPKDITPPYIVVEKTSGGNENHIQSATLAIQSYGKSLHAAASLNEKMKKVMEDITDLNEVSRAELNTDYNYTDTIRKKYRYQAVFDFVYY